MSYAIELHELANEEYISAYEWYEAREEGIGERFMAAVEQRLLQIVEHPLRYSVHHAKYRQVKVNRFPYSITYQVFPRKGIVHISSIRHASRSNHGKYRRRKL